MFASNFAPRSWALCDGQLIAISQNDALFSLFGTTYGGDGRTTFGLPDLRGRLPIHQGSGPGLTPRQLGSKAGAETVQLNVNELASHTHPMQVSSELSDSPNPGSNVTARPTSVDLYIDQAPSWPLNSEAITWVGGVQAHNNVMPFQVINFIVALFGVYPSRSLSPLIASGSAQRKGISHV
jgi:microcystin-dependent protein